MLLMGKLTISMVIFNSFLYVYQRVITTPGLPRPSCREDPPEVATAHRRHAAARGHVVDGGGAVFRGYDDLSPAGGLVVSMATIPSGYD